MSKRNWGVTVFVKSVGLMWVGSATAKLTAEEKCIQDKQNAVKKRAICVAEEQFKAAKGKPFDLEKCETKFDTDIAKADEKAAKKGASCQYVDNGDGTITNLADGCMWEQKEAGSSSTPTDSQGVGDCLNCVDDEYNWAQMHEWVSALNGRTDDHTIQTGHAGYTDWRPPTVGELKSILVAPHPCGPIPCIDPVFGPTAASVYWSSTSFASDPIEAWRVTFSNGNVDTSFKVDDGHVRAVRRCVD